MSKTSWKLRTMSREASAAIAATGSLRQAAKKIGVSPSTLSRAVKEGRLPAPGQPRRKPGSTPPASVAAADVTSVAEWIHHAFNLTPDEAAIADCGQKALDMANDETLPPSVRLAAMREYRACRKDLNLPTEELENDGHSEANVRRYPRPV